MEGTAFNFKDFLMKFITEQPTVENMKLSDGLRVNEFIARIFSNEELMESVLKIDSADEETQVQKLSMDCEGLLAQLNGLKSSEVPALKNVNDAFRRTLAFNAAVYAGLLEQYCFTYLENADEVIERAGSIKAKAAELGVTDVADGVWDMTKIDTSRGPKYFSRAALRSMITTFESLVDDIEEKEAKAAEKAARDAAKADDTDNEKELLDAWRQADWVNIDPTVSSLLRTLGTLYRSGIESMAQAGILMNNGPERSPLICVKCNQTAEGTLDGGIENKIDSGFRTDLKIISTITTALPNMAAMQGIDNKTGFPTLAALYTNEGVMYFAHLMFQSVNIPLSGLDHNKNSIKRWIKDTKGMSGEEWIKTENRSNRTRINKYSDAEAWYKWVIENTLFRYFIEAGLKPTEPTATAVDTIDKICETFARKLKNVIVVAERQSKGKLLQSTELRIATDQIYDPVQLAANIARDLNTGNAKDITAAPRATINQVTAIRIVYDQAAANAATVFASEIAQSLINGGNVPQWNKVLLGRTPNGEFLFWEDFMYGKQAADRAYAIYAGSGAGKGIMTLTLMAAAISDRKQLFYTDGKPDSGASIGALAWKDGKEMYMFDGQSQGGDAFPGYLEANPVTNGMRDPQETLRYTAAIPKGLFTSDAEVREFLGVCRYLRSMTLCADILTARGGKGLLKNSPVPEEDFQIWVFDEMTSMSGHERSIRQKFANYVASKGFKFGVTKKDNSGQACLVGFKPGKDYADATTPGSEKYDAGVAYIADWLNWLIPLRQKFADLSVIGLRNAQANIFFIFQNAEWLSNERDGAITTIAAVVQMLQCRKFVGANGLAKACGHYGDGNTMRTEWASQISSGGWWAVSNASDIRQEGTKMTIFKPYSIWGFRKPGNVGHDERYLDYYCNLILNGRVSASEVLQSAWDFAENAIQELAASKVINPTASLKDYIYNVEKFSLDGEVYDPSTLTNEEEQSADFSDPADMFNRNLFKDTAAPINPLEDVAKGTEYAPDGYEDYAEEADTEEPPITPVSPAPTSGTEEANPVTPVDFERHNDGYDAAREEQARAKAEQQAELERLRELAAKRETPAPTPAPSNELADRLKSLSSLSGDEQQRAIEEMTRQIMAGDWSIHKNMPQVTKEEAEKAGTVTAHDTAEVFSMKNGQLHFDPKNIPAENLRDLKTGEGGNYVNFPHPVINNSFFESDNPRKLEKGKASAWKTFVAGLIREFKGRNAISHVRLTANEIIVNGRLVEHGFLENSYISSLSQIADIRYLLEQLTNLTIFEIAQDMLTTLYLQTNDQYDNPDSKKTNRAFEEYLFMDLCPKLNKFIILGAKPLSLTRAQFVTMRKEKKKQQSAMYKALKQETAAKQGIRDIKKNFIKNSGGTYHMSDTQSRYAATQKKYKGGRAGKFLYNLFDRIAPGE